jgi:hypothetical protein
LQRHKGAALLSALYRLLTFACQQEVATMALFLINAKADFRHGNADILKDGPKFNENTANPLTEVTRE